MTLRLRYLTFEAPRAVLGLAALARGARPWFPGVPTRSELNVRPGRTRSRFAELRLAEERTRRDENQIFEKLPENRPRQDAPSFNSYQE